MTWITFAIARNKNSTVKHIVMSSFGHHAVGINSDCIYVHTIHSIKNVGIVKITNEIACNNPN
jgi:hypothetical protein